MKNYLKMLLKSISLLIIFTILCSFFYPFFVCFVSQIAFSFQANGSLIKNHKGEVIGSTLIAQKFTQENYFHPRPSAAGKEGYGGAASGSSKIPVFSKDFKTKLAQRAQEYRKGNQVPNHTAIPIDAITTSASGLDPHISLLNAYLQAERVSHARGMKQEEIWELIEGEKKGTFLGLFGEERVNVLLLNLALDQRAAHTKYQSGSSGSSEGTAPSGIDTSSSTTSSASVTRAP